jgi:hypothetical protein
MCDYNSCNQRRPQVSCIDDARKNICKCRCKCIVPCKGPCRAQYELPCRGLCRNPEPKRCCEPEPNEENKDCDPCGKCYVWTTPVASDDTTTLPFNPKPQPDGAMDAFYFPVRIFLNCVMKKISHLRISECAKQNFIRSVMDIQIPVHPLPLNSTDASDFYIILMKSILLSISAKWVLYVDPDLVGCCDNSGEITRKLFFIDLSNNLPKPPPPVPPPPVPPTPEPPTPVVFITSANTQTIQNFITTYLLC